MVNIISKKNKFNVCLPFSSIIDISIRQRYLKNEQEVSIKMKTKYMSKNNLNKLSNMETISIIIKHYKLIFLIEGRNIVIKNDGKYTIIEAICEHNMLLHEHNYVELVKNIYPEKYNFPDA